MASGPNRTLIRETRRRVNATVEDAYGALSDLVDGDFSPGYFNRPAVLAAERDGLSVLDGILGHVLHFQPNENLERRSLELITRVTAAIDESAHTNRCHNVSGAIALFLDLIGCPAIVVWGSVHVSHSDLGSIVLNACVPPGPGGRSGHSWVLSPFWWVADLILAYQSGLPDEYDDLQPLIPTQIINRTRETNEPDVNWWRFLGTRRTIVPVQYANETKYQDLLGWSKLEEQGLVMRHLPGAVALPDETDLNDIDISFDGIAAGDFFEARLQDLTTPS